MADKEKGVDVALKNAKQAVHDVSRVVPVAAKLGVKVLFENVWNGFGYDPLFYVPDQGCSSAELAPEVKNRISHRARASAMLLAALQGR